MAARRLILAMIVLLVISSVAAALIPVERRAGRSSTSTETSTVDQPGPTGELVNATLGTGGKKPQTVAIKLGDQLALRVTSKVSDQVEIPALGELEPVDRDAPARFDLLPFEPGRYVVRVVSSGEPAGWIVVTRPQKPQEESSTDSPGSSTAARTSGARAAS